MFLLAEIAAVDGSLADPSDELWHDLETVRAALDELARPPSRVHVATETAILVERSVAIDRLIDDCKTVAQRLRARPTPHPALRVRLVVGDTPPADDAPPDPTEPVVVVVAPRLA